ncbi:MAG: hypothetical protein KAV82_04835, partial [Phycisphaerae bacterium]|nr:hypothetical protein [Phycisphaerae bacterium]
MKLNGGTKSLVLSGITPVVVMSLLLLASTPVYAVVTFTTDVLIAADDWQYDGEDIIVQGCSVTIDGAHSFNSLTIENNGVVTHSYNGANPDYMLDLAISDYVQVDLGSRIDVTGRGYTSLNGPGAGGDSSSGGGGGGHGGVGGSGSQGGGGGVYGSVIEPMHLGSGGGRAYSYSDNGGTGGGVVKLIIGGALTLDGTISANGNAGEWDRAGGGAGGSVWIAAGTLAGSGDLTANGGSGNNYGGGGAGGRIAVYTDANIFGGLMSAYGGGGYNPGGAGTVYTEVSAEPRGLLVIDNAGVGGGLTRLNTSFWPSHELFDLDVSNGALVWPEEAMGFYSVHVGAGGTLSHEAGQTVFDLTTESDFTVDVDGALLADGKGSGSESGTAAGQTASSSGGGGGHGGVGGNGDTSSGGSVYGSVIEPMHLGSGGGRAYSYSDNGGAGGGVIKLIIGGALTLDGTINANGNAGGWDRGGGGAGGSVWIAAGTLAGSGDLIANGGSGNNHGGGGAGGRIAVYTDANTFGGLMSAYGGSGHSPGGAGTVYTEVSTEPQGLLVIDNAGVAGGLTRLNTSFWQGHGLFDLDVSNGALVWPEEAMGFYSVHIRAGGTLSHEAGQTVFDLTTESDFTVDVDGALLADGKGSGSESGTAAGQTSHYDGGGGGHGGVGGSGSHSSGGGVYGSVIEPAHLGSGGGRSSSYGQNGGAGGGVVKLSVGGVLTLDGTISAGGNAGVWDRGGGGAGGSVWIAAGTLAGSGDLIANGGSGNTYGGGGAGGRIAVYTDVNMFGGLMSAYGGSGYHPGGAGTVYTEVSTEPRGLLVIDNASVTGGLTRLNTSFWQSHGLFDLDVSNGALVWPEEAMGFYSVHIRAGGTLSHEAGQTVFDLTTESDFTVDVGGAILANGKGSGSESGTAAGQTAYHSGGGGGHGGVGGSGYNGSGGGGVYGSVIEPAHLGSGGGRSSGYGYNGGAGGGVIKLTVGGVLTLDGTISACGNAGSADRGGGGAGGSIWIAADTLAGSGDVTANGGSGHSHGGGGAGGRIAFHYDDNTLSGAITAYGGPGHSRGGAGTIFTKRAAAAHGHLLIDNGGNAGGLTRLHVGLWPVTVFFDLTIANSAKVYPETPLTFVNLDVESGGVFSHDTGIDVFDITVLEDANVDSNGWLSADGRGDGEATGPGAGQSAYHNGGGGGYGGAGGNGSNSSGGVVYGLATEPTHLGSGGGRSTGYGQAGGRAGGKLMLTVMNALTLDGTINANGNSGAGDRGGAGSGGSIYLTVGSLAGSGAISAAGGNGHMYGGGGGGGRVAIYTADLQIDMGQITVGGGQGHQDGGVGTIYLGTEPPLRVLSQTPDGLVNYPVDSVDIRFNHEIQPDTFTTDDLTLVGPDTIEIPISDPPQGLGDKTWRISFAELSTNGTYTLLVAPHILDLAGSEMDQDGDGAPGEDPDDVYSGSFTIDTVQPEIIEQTPTGEVSVIVDHIDLTFSEPVFADGCAEGDILLSGPNGDIEVSAPEHIGGEVWRISFVPQVASGEYTLTIASECFVDQAGLGFAETYVDGFTIALDPGRQVLVVTVNGGYNGDGASLYQTVVNAGANATYVVLSADGQVADMLTSNGYDQVWVYDLSSGADSYPTDWQAIADWCAARPGYDIICDGRIISSYWNGRWGDEGQRLTENYFENLRANPSGGLVLGTDHDAYQGGINSINALIGIVPFCCNFSLNMIPVDTGHPLMTTPNNMGTELYDDSSPGQTPYGLQPNGRILYTVAWHSNNPDTPGISSTIEGTIGFRVEINSPEDGSSFGVGESITFTTQVFNGESPFTYDWSSDLDGSLGTGETLETSSLSIGDHQITVLAEDNGGRDDDDTISVSIFATPDLEVTDITTPCAGAQGESFEVTWTVTNNGTATASGTWSDRILLSDDAAIGGDTVLATFSHTGDLAPTEIYTHTETVILPGDVLGEHWIVVVTDVHDNVAEYTGEPNNTSIDDESFYIHTPDVVSLCAWSEVDYESGGAGNWVVAADGLSVLQTVNGEPTFFVSDFDLSGSQFQGSFLVPSGWDDDYIGFVFGFKGVGGTDVGEGYYLLSWKKGNQGGAEAGFKLVKIIGPSPDLWDIEPTEGQIVELAEHAGSNSWGWQYGVQYEFFLTYQANGNIRVIIHRESDGAELWNTGLVSDPDPLGPGKVGFYNFSQENVTYAGFTQAELLPPIAAAGGPYVIDANTSGATLDATASFDPDGTVGGFDDIESVQWDLGDDGIDDDVDRVNPLQPITLSEAIAKGLAIGTDVPVGLEVTDIDGQPGTDLTSIRYESTAPTADAGGPYGPITAGEFVEFAGIVDDLDLPLDVGEALTVEWDFAPATNPGQVGDGFVSQADATISFETLLPLVAQHGETIYLNVKDAAGLIASASTTVTLLVPDLEVMSLLAPTTATGGDTVIMEYSVENTGSDTVFINWQDAIYLSDNEVLDGGDQLLRLSPMNEAPLAPGEHYCVSRTVTLPVSYEAYTAYLIVKTDNGNAVQELNESNNVLASDAIEVEITPAPDLMAADVVAPGSAVFGEEITVEWAGQNVGTLAATDLWSDLVFLSTDEQLSTDDRYLGALSIDAAPLEPGAPAYPGLLVVTLPLDLQTHDGDYYVLVKADGNNAIEELDETNNLASFGPMTVELPPLPNLQILDISVPSSVAVGKTAHLEWTITNSGGESTDGSFLMTVYVSSDGQVGGDTALQNVLFEDTIASGEGVPQSADVMIPEMGTDNLFFVICADTVQDILESNESDNCTISTTGVVYNRPDLAVTAMTAPSDAVAESTVEVTWTVENIGDATAVPYWIDAVYLSNDAVFGNDILLRTEAHATALDDQANYNVQVSVTIPDSLAGDYYFIVETDRGNRVIETGDPANNVWVAESATTITQPDRPNLVVSDIVTPISGLVGQPVTVEWAVTNIGAAAASGFWIDRVVASLDDQLSPDDIELGNAQSETPLDPTESYTRQASFHYPSVPGDYYIIVTTDAMNAVHEGLEGGEDDNTTADDATFVAASFTATADADIDDALAGTPVTITGQAVIEGTSDPAVDVPVVVRVNVRGFERRLTDRSDGDGQYEVVFQPGPTEGGLYSVSAGPGHASGLPVSDQFRLWSMLTIPKTVYESVFPGVPQSSQFSLKNPGDLPLTGVQASVQGAPANVTVEVTIEDGATLAGLTTTAVHYTVTASDDTPVNDPISINFTSDQGATDTTTLWVTVAPATPTLIVVPEDLVSGELNTVMVRGERTYTQFRVRNIGGAATGELNVLLPAVSWITLATPTPLDPIAPGGEAAVVVQLDPPEDLPLGQYTGSFSVQGPGSAVGVPFRFIATSVGLGDLLVRTTDEFTYYATGYPMVAGARVSISDHVTGDLVATGYTDADGEILFTNLTEAYYDIEATADEHGTFRTTILVVAAEVIEVDAFMPRQVVNYSWTVIPIDYEDEYIITIEAVFETQVPAPVVVIEPTSIDLDALTLPAQIDFTITNYGLITADNVRFNVDSNDAYELIPLVTEIGDLPGGCTPADPFGPCRVTVPVLVIPTGKSRTPCTSVHVWECHDLICGDEVYTTCGWSVLYSGDCGGGGGGGGG